MSLSTRSSFYYGYTISQGTNKLDFNEGGAEIQATLRVGRYSMESLALEIKRAMDAVGGQEYSVSVDRATRKYTISAAGSFSLLAATGSRVGQGPWTILGFTADKTGASSHESDVASGSEFRPQFWLQDYINKNHWKDSVKSVVNESASGAIEVVQFGEVQFYQFNIKYQTNKPQAAGAPIENDLTGVDNLVAFMDFVITKGLVEFMPNRDTPSTFDTIRVEKIPSSAKGTSYKLRELYDKNLPDYYDTGKLVWRVIS